MNAPRENRAVLAPSASSIKIGDFEPKILQPRDNPIGTRLSPMCPVRSVTYVSGPDTGLAGWGAGAPGFEPRNGGIKIGCYTCYFNYLGGPESTPSPSVIGAKVVAVTLWRSGA